MWEAFRDQPRRRHNTQRAELLRDSRDEPWSVAERLQHQLLHAHRITGWRGNRWVRVGDRGYVVDVIFERERVILEIDGWDGHGMREAFQHDRRRRSGLVPVGYRVLNFTWRQLVEDLDWVMARIGAALGR